MINETTSLTASNLRLVAVSVVSVWAVSQRKIVPLGALQLTLPGCSFAKYFFPCRAAFLTLVWMQLQTMCLADGIRGQVDFAESAGS